MTTWSLNNVLALRNQPVTIPEAESLPLIDLALDLVPWTLDDSEAPEGTAPYYAEVTFSQWDHQQPDARFILRFSNHENLVALMEVDQPELSDKDFVRVQDVLKKHGFTLLDREVGYGAWEELFTQTGE